MKLGGFAVFAFCLLAGVARAGEPTVTIELRTGERVTGRLQGFGEKRYRVKIGEQTLSLREEDVRRIEFGEPAPPRAAPGEAAAVATSGLTAEDLLLKASDLPDAITVKRVLSRGPTSLAGFSSAIANDKTLAAPAFGNLVDALRGVEEVANEELEERGTTYLAVFCYGSAAEADSRFHALRRACLDDTAGVSFPDVLPAPANEIWRAGRFSVALRDDGLTPMAHDAVRKALLAKLDRAAPGAVRSEVLAPAADVPGRRTRASSLHGDILYVSPVWLPEPFDVKVNDYTDAPTIAIRGKQNPPEPSISLEHSVVYSNPRGTVTLERYKRKHAAAGEPDPADLAPFRSAWLAGVALWSLETTGEVSESTVAWFDRYVAGELRKLDRGVKRLTGELAPGASSPAPSALAPATPAPAPIPAKAIKLMDLLPTVDELPPGFSFKPGSMENIGGFHGWSTSAEFVRATLLERGAVEVVVFRWRDGHSGMNDAGQDAFMAAKTPTVILSTDHWLVELANTLGASVEGFADLEKLFHDKLEGLGDGPVMRTQPPILREKFVVGDLAVPAPRLPGDLVRTSDVAPVCTFGHAASSAEEEVGYAKGTSRVWLRVFHVRSKPSSTELRRFRAAWLAGDLGVALETTGDVPAETVEALARFVDAELAACAPTHDAKRLEIPAAPHISAVEMVPTADELPSWLAEVPSHERRAGPDDLRRDDVSASLTLQPLLAAVNGGAEEMVQVAFRERGELALVLRSYASPELAERALEATKRARAVPDIFANVREVLIAGNVVAVIEDEGVTAEAYDAVRKALVERLAHAGPVHSERFELASEQLSESSFRLLVPDHLLPRGFAASKDDLHEAGLKGTLFEGFDASVWNPVYRYSGTDGSVELRAIVTGKRLPGPTGEQIKPYRSVWVFGGGQAAVSLRTEGVVPDDVVRFFVAHVESELSRCADGKDAKRFDAPFVKFTVTIENKTEHTIEPGHLTTVPGDTVRIAEGVRVAPGEKFTLDLGYVPRAIAVSVGREITEDESRDDKHFIVSTELPSKALKLGVDYQADSKGVTITYP